MRAMETHVDARSVFSSGEAGAFTLAGRVFDTLPDQIRFVPHGEKLAGKVFPPVLDQETVAAVIKRLGFVWSAGGQACDDILCLTHIGHIGVADVVGALRPNLAPR